MTTQFTIDVSDLREQLITHPLYERITHHHDGLSVRIFMESHVFAVWDFLSLLKSLQRRFTCIEVPWYPKGDPKLRRFVNEIVLDEESDIGPDEEPTSHYELYRKAMWQAGADSEAIDYFTLAIGLDRDVGEALVESNVPDGARRFVTTTMGYVRDAPDHVLAAVFAYGREELIPPMFHRVIDRLCADSTDRWSLLQFYLQRHIEHDADTHAPLARAMVTRACSNEAKRWDEAQQAARFALLARVELWNSIVARIDSANAAHRIGG